jgi:integrase
MKLTDAAAYCGLNSRQFSSTFPGRPTVIQDRVLYDRHLIDQWIDAQRTDGFAGPPATSASLAPSEHGASLSVGELINSYKNSIEFQSLKPQTKRDYTRVTDWLLRHADTPVACLSAGTIYKLRDQAFADHKWRFANYVVQVIRLVLSWAKGRGILNDNPALGIKLIKRPDVARANRPWSDGERRAVLETAAIELRLFVAIGMYTGLREADVCALTRQSYNGERISTVASKNGEKISISVHFVLRQILDESSLVLATRLTRRARRYNLSRSDPAALTVTSRCQPWTPAGFRASFFKLVNRLEASGKVNPGLTFHGLRHTLGKLIMEAGGSKEDVGMVLGDRSIAMAHFYSREHEKQARVDVAVQRLEALEDSRQLMARGQGFPSRQI